MAALRFEGHHTMARQASPREEALFSLADAQKMLQAPVLLLAHGMSEDKERRRASGVGSPSSTNASTSCSPGCESPGAIVVAALSSGELPSEEALAAGDLPSVVDRSIDVELNAVGDSYYGDSACGVSRSTAAEPLIASESSPSMKQSIVEPLKTGQSPPVDRQSIVQEMLSLGESSPSAAEARPNEDASAPPSSVPEAQLKSLPEEIDRSDESPFMGEPPSLAGPDISEAELIEAELTTMLAQEVASSYVSQLTAGTVLDVELARLQTLLDVDNRGSPQPIGDDGQEPVLSAAAPALDAVDAILPHALAEPDEESRELCTEEPRANADLSTADTLSPSAEGERNVDTCTMSAPTMNVQPEAPLLRPVEATIELLSEGPVAPDLLPTAECEHDVKASATSPQGVQHEPLPLQDRLATENAGLAKGNMQVAGTMASRASSRESRSRGSKESRRRGSKDSRGRGSRDSRARSSGELLPNMPLHQSMDESMDEAEAEMLRKVLGAEDGSDSGNERMCSPERFLEGGDLPERANVVYFKTPWEERSARAVLGKTKQSTSQRFSARTGYSYCQERLRSLVTRGSASSSHMREINRSMALAGLRHSRTALQTAREVEAWQSVRSTSKSLPRPQSKGSICGRPSKHASRSRPVLSFPMHHKDYQDANYAAVLPQPDGHNTMVPDADSESVAAWHTVLGARRYRL